MTVLKLLIPWMYIKQSCSIIMFQVWISRTIKMHNKTKPHGIITLTWWNLTQRSKLRAIILKSENQKILIREWKRYGKRQNSDTCPEGDQILIRTAVSFYTSIRTVRPEPSDLIQLGLWDGYDWDFDLNDYELIDYYLRTFFWVTW